jgi:hypothetical protein
MNDNTRFFTAHKISLLHALTLMGLGVSDFLSRNQGTVDVMVPVLFGVVLLSLSNGLLYRLRAQVNAAIVVTLVSVLLAGFRLYLMATMKNGWMLVAMMVTGMLSVVFLIAERPKSSK